jgi:hypothetical protein
MLRIRLKNAVPAFESAGERGECGPAQGHEDERKSDPLHDPGPNDGRGGHVGRKAGHFVQRSPSSTSLQVPFFQVCNRASALVSLLGTRDEPEN